MNKQDILREIRFYVCVTLASAVIFTGIMIPPEGELHRTLLEVSVVIMVIGAMCVGLDIKGIIHEIRIMMYQGKHLLEEDKTDETK